MARFDLTGFEESVIQPLFTGQVARRAAGGRAAGLERHRLAVADGTASGADIPSRHGPHTTCVNRFNRWRNVGVWERLRQAVSAAYDGDIQMIDSASIRVRQHAANIPKKTTDPVAGVASAAG